MEPNTAIHENACEISGVDGMLARLEPAIDMKCEELQAARKEKLQLRLFFLLCVLAVLVPALLVFAGVSFTVFVAPFVFASLSVVFLLPVLLSYKETSQGGLRYENA